MLGLVSALVRAPVFPLALQAGVNWSRESGTALFTIAGLPTWAMWLIALPLLDLSHYSWHVASHRWAPLWRFHSVHHHDDAVDSTTALRFHAGDAVLSSIITVVVAALVGITVQQVLVYEALLLPASVFHHANIRIPARLDRLLGWLVVTPAMHRVHHSQWVRETDSNYSSILSVWDRMFGTLNVRPDARDLRVGLDGYSAFDTSTLLGCLRTPFARIKSRAGIDTLALAARRRRPQPGD